MNSTRETVSVCIPTYNQARYLAGAIRSVLAQHHPIDEIIVSDDASADETPAVCREFAREIRFFRYHRQERNLGIEGNVDFVLRQATSDFVVRLDSDDRLFPGYTDRLLDAMRDAPGAAYAHGDVREIDSEGRRYRLRTLHRAPGFQAAREALLASLWGYRVTANILLFRRSALERVDYNRGRGDFAEDYHLSVALARAGLGNVYVDEPLAEYRVWSDQRGVRARRKERELAGLVRVFQEQVEPGFREAGLPLGPVRRARRAQALRHVLVLDQEGYSEEKKEGLEADLRTLGDSWLLRLCIRLNRRRYGFVVRYAWRAVDSLRRTAKKTLRFFARS